MRTAWAFLSLVVGLCPAPSRGAEAAARPNVVFILADDLGWRDVGCYGSTFHKTPNIDRLASRGVRLTNAYAASPLCSPTRSSILTGLYPARTGITAPNCHLQEVRLEKGLAAGRQPGVKVVPAESLTRLKPEYTTVAEILRDAGYATAHFGKWHLGFNKGPDDRFEPRDHGFGIDWPHAPSVPGPGGGYLGPWKFVKDPAIVGKPGEHIEDRMSAEAAAFIRANKDRPFFLNYWAYSVHSPWNAADEDIETFKKSVDAKDPQHNPLYAAMVKRLDDAVGRLMAAIDEAGVADRTIVVFTSDNGGWAFPPKATTPAGYEQTPATSNLPLRSGKASLYEGGTREPCVVAWPGRVKAGTTADALFQSVDWFPTLLALCEIASGQSVKVDGVDQSGLILGTATAPARDRIFCHFPHGGTQQAQAIPGFLPGAYVRRGDWKLIRFFADNDDGGDRLELYDLKADVGETTNLASRQPAVAREMDDLLGGFLRETGAVIPIRNPAYDGAKAEPAADPLKGWKARNCDATAKGGVLTITAKPGAAPFLGIAPGGRGPTTVTLRARCAGGGDGKVERVPPGKGAGEATAVAFKLDGGGDWQTVTVEITDKGPLGIVRVYLPAQAQAVDVQWIELKPAGGAAKRWAF